MSSLEGAGRTGQMTGLCFSLEVALPEGDWPSSRFHLKHGALLTRYNPGHLAVVNLLRSDERGQCPLTCCAGVNPATAKKGMSHEH